MNASPKKGAFSSPRNLDDAQPHPAYDDLGNGTAKIDNDQLADFRNAIKDKREVTNALAELRGRKAHYRAEVLAGDREPDPDYEYELAQAERRFAHVEVNDVVNLAKLESDEPKGGSLVEVSNACFHQLFE
jgi:hypothetical protein